MADIVRMNVMNISGVLNLDARPLKNMLAPIPATCAEEIKSYLHQLFDEYSQKCIKSFKDHSGEVSGRPTALKDYTDYIILLQNLDCENFRLSHNVKFLLIHFIIIIILVL
jgi:hypothetical protein